MVLLVLFGGFNTEGNASGRAEAPRFEDFPVPAAERFKGMPAAVRLTSPEARRYRTMIRAGARKGPNFAGHYTIVEWGCGAGCAQFEVVDARTGAVYDPPFYVGLRTHFTGGGAQPDPPLEFRIDSKLLIVSGAPNEENEGFFYYKWDGKCLRLLAKTQF
jgi:hypothetical protein